MITLTIFGEEHKFSCFACSLVVCSYVDRWGKIMLQVPMWEFNMFNSFTVWCSHVHLVKFLIIQPTGCTYISYLFLEWKSTCCRQFLCPSSGVFHCTHSNVICQQMCMTYTIVVCTVKNYWWWTEELSETCRGSFQE
jgi:hypothetical protein